MIVIEFRPFIESCPILTLRWSCPSMENPISTTTVVSCATTCRSPYAFIRIIIVIMRLQMRCQWRLPLASDEPWVVVVGNNNNNNHLFETGKMIECLWTTTTTTTTSSEINCFAGKHHGCQICRLVPHNNGPVEANYYPSSDHHHHTRSKAKILQEMKKEKGKFLPVSQLNRPIIHPSANTTNQSCPFIHSFIY